MMKMLRKFVISGGHPYKMSKKRDEYERIAMVYNVTPDYVYYLAHGETIGHRNYDGMIREELKRCGII